MTELSIDVIPDMSSLDSPRRIVIRAGSTVFTRLMRPDASASDDALRAPPGLLAFWLAENWWRLRWECVPPDRWSPGWRMAHELAAIGGGYVWPRLSIWGEGERVGLSNVSDPEGLAGPVRYLTRALIFVPALEFERAIDLFLERAASSSADLREVVEILASERADPDVAEWRRLEAQLGFDIDQAPEGLMHRMASLATQYGFAGIEEAAMATPGPQAADILEQHVEIAKSCGVVCHFGQTVKAAGRVSHPVQASPWQIAEDVARRVRMELGIGRGPLSNKKLADIFGLTEDFFRSGQNPSVLFEYGIRVQAQSKGDAVALLSRSSRGRRFEFIRAVGDAIWAGEDNLGPLAWSRTARQKFQRAFAQSFLCPYEDLATYLGRQNPSEDDITAAAEHFQVSENVIRTILVNKRVTPRRFNEMVEVA